MVLTYTMPRKIVQFRKFLLLSAIRSLQVFEILQPHWEPMLGEAVEWTTGLAMQIPRRENRQDKDFFSNGANKALPRIRLQTSATKLHRWLARWYRWPGYAEFRHLICQGSVKFVTFAVPCIGWGCTAWLVLGFQLARSSYIWSFVQNKPSLFWWK